MSEPVCNGMPALAFFVVMMALSARWLVALVRSFAFMESRLLAGKKPWACNVCMSFWTCGVLCGTAALAWGEWALVLMWLPATGACFTLLEISPGQGPPV